MVVINPLAVVEAAKYIGAYLVGIQAAAWAGEKVAEDMAAPLYRALGWMPDNPGHNPAVPTVPTVPKKKRKANRYAILLKQEYKKSRLTGKTAVGRKKKFAAAAKKASMLYKKEQKNGSKKTKSAR